MFNPFKVVGEAFYELDTTERLAIHFASTVPAAIANQAHLAVWVLGFFLVDFGLTCLVASFKVGNDDGDNDKLKVA